MGLLQIISAYKSRQVCVGGVWGVGNAETGVRVRMYMCVRACMHEYMCLCVGRVSQSGECAHACVLACMPTYVFVGREEKTLNVTQ